MSAPELLELLELPELEDASAVASVPSLAPPLQAITHVARPTCIHERVTDAP
jgi:hypothetical protein